MHPPLFLTLTLVNQNHYKISSNPESRISRSLKPFFILEALSEITLEILSELLKAETTSQTMKLTSVAT